MCIRDRYHASLVVIRPTSRVNTRDNAIASVRLSVRPSVVTLTFEPRTVDHGFCVCMSYDHSFPGIEGQGQWSRSNFKSSGQRLKCSRSRGQSERDPYSSTVFTARRLAKRGICRCRVSVCVFVCLCVCVSVTLRYCIKTARITQTTPHDSPMTLVF